MVNVINSSNTSFTKSLSDLIDYPKSGILSQVLLKDNNSQYTLFCLAKGTEIEEHTSTRNAIITVIEGEGILTLEGKDIVLTPGVFVFMAANAPHAVFAQENLAFMLALSEHPQPNNKISQKTIEIVKATAPILKKQGKEITTRMYEIMFSSHPEIQHQFDMRSQANGSQPVKLANAVLNFATHIDNLNALNSMVETIAHRHVQTHVQPEQYPIVGESLLQAIKDVLGNGATEEVITAWTEAYQVLSEIFINKEKQIAHSNYL